MKRNDTNRRGPWDATKSITPHHVQALLGLQGIPCMGYQARLNHDANPIYFIGEATLIILHHSTIWKFPFLQRMHTNSVSRMWCGSPGYRASHPQERQCPVVPGWSPPHELGCRLGGGSRGDPTWHPNFQVGVSP